MTDRPPAQRSSQEDREARLARALRENLRRRKAQARGKADTAAGEEIAQSPAAIDGPARSKPDR